MMADNPAIFLGGVPIEVHEYTGLLPDLLSAQLYSLPILFYTSGTLVEPASFLNVISFQKYHLFNSDITFTYLT